MVHRCEAGLVHGRQAGVVHGCEAGLVHGRGAGLVHGRGTGMVHRCEALGKVGYCLVYSGAPGARPSCLSIGG